MRRFFFATLVSAILPMTALASHDDAYEAIQKAQQLTYLLNNLTYVAQDEAENAARYGDQQAAAELRFIAMQASGIGQRVEAGVVRPLQNWNGARIAERNFSQLDRAFYDLNQSALRLRRVSFQIRRLVNEVDRDRYELAQILRALTNGGGGGGGGGGRGFVGTCQVVLETVWGANIKLFYGRAIANNPQTARAFAERDAMQQCQREQRGVVTRCVVNYAQCSASPGGRPF